MKKSGNLFNDPRICVCDYMYACKYACIYIYTEKE